MFVHGLFSSDRAWQPFVTLLADDPELAGRVVARCLRYDSPVLRVRPDRRIAQLDDVADRLDTFLRTELAGADRSCSSPTARVAWWCSATWPARCPTAAAASWPGSGGS